MISPICVSATLGQTRCLFVADSWHKAGRRPITGAAEVSAPHICQNGEHAAPRAAAVSHEAKKNNKKQKQAVKLGSEKKEKKLKAVKS